MSIRREPRRERFTRVDNLTVEDGRLSFKALGLLVYLLSKPDNWTVSREHLAGTHADGIASVRTALAELRAAGYITTEEVRDDHGRIVERGNVVHERPVAEPEDGDDPDDSPAPPGGSPSGGPSSRLVSRREVSRDVVTTERSSPRSEATTEVPTPSPPTAGQLALVDESPTASGAPDPDAGFSAFWAAYPRKAAKGDARKAWRQMRRAGAPVDAIVMGAERYARDPNRVDRFTKLPASWLRAECWDDPPLPARDERGRGSSARPGRADEAMLQRHRELLDSDPFFAEQAVAGR